MTHLWDGGQLRPRQGLFRAAACLMALAAAACFTSSDRGTSPPTGVIGILPGGSKGSNGGNFDGTYRLQTAHGIPVPALLFYDSTLGTNDTVFSASFDSSFISLNTDNSAREVDFLTVRDIRTDGDSDVNRTVSFGDTTGGIWSVSGQTVTLTRTDTVGGAHQVVTQFTASSNLLTGVITFSLFNTAGNFVATDTATVVYAFTGPPLSNRVGGASGAPMGASMDAGMGPSMGAMRGRAAPAGARARAPAQAPIILRPPTVRAGRGSLAVLRQRRVG
jgi:hypothetical protein